MLIRKSEGVHLKNYDSKAFIKDLNDADDIYENIEEYSPKNKRKVFIVFDDIIPDMLSIKKLHQIVTELFIRGRKLNIYTNLLDCTKKYYFNSTQYFIMKNPNKW